MVTTNTHKVDNTDNEPNFSDPEDFNDDASNEGISRSRMGIINHQYLLVDNHE
jgi:hypothetical protein